MPNTREKLEVIAHLGDHITYREDIGICYDSALAKVIEDAYMTLKNGVTLDNQVASSSKYLASSEWISVKDRLPEGMDWVLCACVDREVRILCYDYIMDDWDIHLRPNSCYAKGFVTHWMPLPQPPKGE